MTFPLFKSFYKLRQFNALNSFFVSSEHTFWENKFSRQEECFSRRKRTNVLSFDPFLSLFCCFSFFCEWCVENVWTWIGPRGKCCAILVSSHVYHARSLDKWKIIRWYFHYCLIAVSIEFDFIILSSSRLAA